MDHGEEAFGQLVVSGGASAVDFEASEEPPGLVALPVEFAVIIDLHTAVGSSWNERFYVPVCKIGTDGICIISLIGQKRLRCPLRQRDQRVTGFAIRRFADCQVEGEWPSSSVSQTVKLTGEPTPRAARSASTSPPFAPAAKT